MSLYIHITEREAPLPPSNKYYRVPRDIERVDWNAKDLRYRGNVPEYANDLYGGSARQVTIDYNKPYPEVYRLKPDHHTILDCYWQRVWRELNPMLSDSKWSSLLGDALAWTNNTGFPGHYNCITGEEKGTQFPRFDAPRLCSNAIVTGVEKDNRLYLDTMLVSNQTMNAHKVINIKHYWYYGTSVNVKGETNYITRLGIDGARHKVIIPVLTSQPVYVLLNELIKM